MLTSYPTCANLQQPAPIQGSLPGRIAEAAAYHDPADSGFFSVLYDDGTGAKRQESFRLRDLSEVLADLHSDRDSWLSQCEFSRPNRRTGNFQRSRLLFADLDTYKAPAMQGMGPEQQTEALLRFCEDAGLPPPSQVIFSGRGLQAKWLLDRPIPAAALPRWQACQARLVERLAPLGADPAAKDASRVLRVVGTVNSKSGQRVRVTHVERCPGSTAPVRYGFEQLCAILLPIPRRVIESAREARQAEREARRLARDAQKRQLSLLEGGKEQADGLIKKSVRSLAWARFLDLRALADLRAGAIEGHRMKLLHWQANFLALAGVVHPGNFWPEVVELARRLDPGWAWRKDELSTIYRKAKDYVDGKTVEFGGREYPPLYTPKNDTLIEIFGISEDEQRHLRTIISKDEVRRRDAQKKQEARRKAGSVSRAEYLTNRSAIAEARREQAEALAARGKSPAEIAKLMGVTIRAVRGWLRSGSI